jgi:hypothetical protein
MLRGYQLLTIKKHRALELAGSYESSNELSGFIKGRDFPE